MPVLTLIDSLNIQGFIFATNRLKDAVGGSWLVSGMNDVIKRQAGEKAVIVLGGGNALLKFSDQTTAKQAVMRISRQMFERAPGLELCVVHQSFEAGSLATAILGAQRALQAAKLSRIPHAPLLGLGVTEPCHETRLPASQIVKDDDRQIPLSSAVSARRPRDASEVATLWHKFLPDGFQRFSRCGGPIVRLDFPLQVDHLGRSHGDRSLLGLIHADGNQIGRLLAEWLNRQAAEASSDENVIIKLKDISQAIDALGQDALRRAVNRVISAVQPNPQGDGYVIENSLGQSFELVCEGGQLKLPIRPILLGGDDLTLLCDGRLALDLAAASLGAFENARIEQFSQPVRACAGVAIGRTHTPVARLFQLAEELCRSAKQHVRESGSDDCGLDWHVAFQSPIESLARLRHRQYRVGEAERVLTARPYLLGNLTAPTVNTWHWLDRVVLGTGDGSFRGDEWTIRRSKVKALRDLIRSGPRDVAQAMHAWHVSAPNLRFPDGINEDGFAGGTTTLLDAIELLDLHWSLESCYVDA